MRSAWRRTLVAGTAVALIAATSLGADSPTYTLGGISCAAAPNNFNFYCFGGFGFTPFESAVMDPANFGPAGTVPVTVTTKALSSFSATDLGGVNGIVVPWWFEGDAGANAALVKAFFLAGGDLFILADDSAHDPVNAALDLPTLDTAGSGVAKPTSGNAPLHNGPFGAATVVNQFFSIGRLDVPTVLAKGGHVVGTDAEGSVTAAVWDRNQYAPGAGRMVIATDVDMVTPEGIPGSPSYAPLNDNGRFALNATAFLVNGGLIDGFEYDLIGVPNCSITPGGFNFYCGTTGTLFAFNAALANPANFGPSGIVKRRVALTALDVITPATLAALKAFIVPWVFDPEAGPYAAALQAYFLGGGNLWLLQDDPDHDPIGALLGVATPNVIGVPNRPTNGSAPIYDGPFGLAADVEQLFAVGDLDAADVVSHGGTVVGTADNGDNAVAVWQQNAYAPGAGRMVIATDVDSTWFSSFAPLNANGIWSLNTLAFLLADVTPPAISCAVSTDTLWPPNGQTVGVVVTGAASDASGLDSASFAFTVIDEYGVVQPSGAVTIGSGGAYSVTVPLVSSRKGNDTNGRTYQIVVAGQDAGGNAGSCTAVVTVLHDQRH